MIISRAINCGIALALLLFFAWLWHRSMKRLHYPLICTCGYALAGLHAMRCPECGRSIRGPTLIRDQLGGIRLKVILLAFLVAAAVCWQCYRITISLLEINRIQRVGPYAFIPGYRLLEGMNHRDVLCICVGLLLAATALRRVAMDSRASFRRVRSELITEMAEHLESIASPPKAPPPSMPINSAEG
jgi:hypothetical protein